MQFKLFELLGCGQYQPSFWKFQFLNIFHQSEGDYTLTTHSNGNTSLEIQYLDSSWGFVFVFLSSSFKRSEMGY